MALPYPLLCALIGFVLGWIPMYLHGPIPEKFNLYYLRGPIAVWSWYTARLLVGVLVGITWWPRRWYLRGPLCGFLMMLPPGIMSLAVPTCGPVCMFWNETTSIVIGVLVAGIAYRVTGKHHALDESPAHMARAAAPLGTGPQDSPSPAVAHRVREGS